MCATLSAAAWEVPSDGDQSNAADQASHQVWEQVREADEEVGAVGHGALSCDIRPRRRLMIEEPTARGPDDLPDSPHATDKGHRKGLSLVRNQLG